MVCVAGSWSAESYNLPLPAWLIETPGSLMRVERARAKGIDMEKMLAKDRPQQEPEKIPAGGKEN